jgi:hypothetical protein
MPSFARAIRCASVLALSGLTATASGPFTQSQSINFYREVVPRDISGLALRSDGRLLAGPILTPLAGIPDADLWWDLERLDGDTWLIASGPAGDVFQADIDLAAGTFALSPWSNSQTNHVFVVKNLGNGVIAGGTNADAKVILWDETGAEITHVELPADSVFDLLWDAEADVLWAATGNPGALYRIDLAVFLDSAVDATLADRGITQRAEVRDRNLRRLAQTAEGHLLAGSDPSGNLYQFHTDGSAPLILMDHDSGEITDLHVSTAGDIYATLVVSSGTTSRRVMSAANVQPPNEPSSNDKPDNPEPVLSIMEAPPIDAFTGRSELILIPDGTGIPQTLSSRNKMAMYRFLKYEDQFVLGGGDDGEVLGYLPAEKRAVSFSGSDSAQINDIEAIDAEGNFLLLTNNPVGLSRLSFSDRGPRIARTSSINLQTPSQIGALRFNRIRGVEPADIAVKMRANRGRDQIEGWTPWAEAEYATGGWRAEGLIGNYVQIEVSLPDAAEPGTELDQAELFYLPQNRRPVLRSFRLISPNFALAPRTVGTSGNTLTLGQVIGSSPNPAADSDNQERQALLSSKVVPQIGAQVVTWTASDVDGDALTATFSVRPQGSTEWIDLGVNLTEDWFQFDRRGLAEGTYFTRLRVQEGAPRPPADRHEVEFATDDLVIDLTPPSITGATVTSTAAGLQLEIDAADSTSALTGVRLRFNNAYELELSYPADGILDGMIETFVTVVDPDLTTGATAVEVYVTDAADNVAIKRLELP